MNTYLRLEHFQVLLGGGAWLGVGSVSTFVRAHGSARRHTLTSEALGDHATKVLPASLPISEHHANVAQSMLLQQGVEAIFAVVKGNHHRALDAFVSDNR